MQKPSSNRPTTTDVASDIRIAVPPPEVCSYCLEPLVICGGCTDIFCDIIDAKVNGSPPGWKPPGRERCDITLLSSDERPLPDHVCRRTAVGTIRRAQTRYFSPASVLSSHIAPHPLPVSYKSIMEYARENRMDVDDLLPPLFHDSEDGWLTLVVERQVKDVGCVILFGLAGEMEDRDAAATRSARGEWFAEMRWEYSEPRSRMDRLPTPVRSGHTLIATERRLRNWYRKRLLGKSIRSGGPKNGPFRFSREDIRNASKYALAELNRLDMEVSPSSLAQFMGHELGPVSRQNVEYWQKIDYLSEL